MNDHVHVAGLVRAQADDPAPGDRGQPVAAERRAFLQRRLAAAVQPERSSPPLRRGEPGPAPPSFAQQRMCFLQELAPGNPFYNIPAALPLNGPIDAAALERALNDIVRRHEALRTVFTRLDGAPVQIVRPWSPTPLELVDMTGAGEAELNRAAQEEAQHPFDLATGPLIRFRLVRAAPDRHLLLLTVHHIAADGWSMGVLFRELSVLYAAHAKGSPADLPDLAVQYADFARWQREHIAGETLETLLAYWRGQLADLRELPLITDRPRPPIASFRGAFLDVRFDRAWTEAARALGADHGCTLFQTVLAAYKAVLARFAGVTDVVVGSPIANRSHPELEPLIGFFVNSLVLRSDLSGDPGFDEILRRVRAGAIEAYAHQDLPFERLVEDLQPDRDLSRNPLFQVSFQIQNAPGATDERPAGGDDFRPVERATSILDLAFSLWETDSGLAGGVEYATDLFDEGSVRRIVEAVELVLQTAALAPATPLSRLPLMRPQAEARWAAALTGPSRPLPPATVDQLFEMAAERHPQRAAVIDAAGVVSFADLDHRAGRIAAALGAAGVCAGDVVGLMLRRSRDFAACMIGVLKAGAAYLPLDCALPPKRLEAVHEAARPKLVILEDDLPAYPHGPSGRLSRLLAHAESCTPRRSVAAGDQAPCYVLFTSGSTGAPKGVAVPHAALLNHMSWMAEALPLGPTDRVLQRTPTHFDASVWELWAPLIGGAAVCLPPPFEAADLPALQESARALGPTVLQAVPSLLAPLLAQPGAAEAFASVRRVCCGGEPLTAALLRQIRAVLPAAEIVNLYGPTETTIDAAWLRMDADAPQDPTPIGRPISNAATLVVDEHGQLVPPNVRGQIVVAGLPLAVGYLGQPELTARRFAPVAAAGGPAFLTGDLGWYREDGMLFCAGRLDRQVKLRGARVELDEIEAVLAGHPVVEAAAVLVHADADGDAALAGFVTLAEGEGAEALRREIEVEAVAEWEGLYQLIYGGEDRETDAREDFRGWTSSYTGQPIPLDEMRRWAEDTVARIRALEPRGIVEIGCGSGLLLSRLAPECARYVACDFSAPSVRRLQDWIGRQNLPQVSLCVAAAHDAAGLDLEGCDTAVLNSVVQYLPSAGHLAAVLGDVGGRLGDGARLFIGDVRPAGVLRAFHASVEAWRSPAETTAGQLRARIEAACAQDKELVLDPAFFRQAAREIAAEHEVTIRLKPGADGNELVRYRYDVTIRLGPPRPPAVLAWKNWRRGEIDLAEIETALRWDRTPIAVTGLPNRRTAVDVALAQALAGADPDTSLAALREAAARAAKAAIDPAVLMDLAAARGLTAELLPSRGHPDQFDLVIHDGALARFSLDASQPGRDPTDRALSSEPTLNALARRLSPELRAHLAAALPPYMIPARLSVLERLPTLPSGKLDRAALARLVPSEPIRDAAFAPPEGPLEQLIAEVFATVLGVRRAGRDDHFFAALGGHSLLATQAVSRLREILQVELPLRTLFEHATPAALAAAVVEAHSGALLTAKLYIAMQDLDEAALDALLAEA